MHSARAVPAVPDASQIMRNGRWLTGAREKIFAGQESPLRDVIAASWQRSMAHGLRPDRFSVPFAGVAAPDGSLVRAAAPIADAVGADLTGTGVSLVVSDHEACILDRRVPDAGLRARLDRLYLAPGFRYGEDTVGTTAISVALSQHGPALVAGGEHYADTLTPMVCAAAPVTDPRTGRVLGTIGLAAPGEDASPLMIALVKRAARDVEQRLSDATAGADRALLERFLRARRQVKGPLAAVSERAMLTNTAAAAVVGERDRVPLWEWASAALRTANLATFQLRLSDGQTVTVRGSRVDGGDIRAGVLLCLDPADDEPAGHRSPGSGLDSLTPTERSIALVIAEGFTNREAAARQYLSRHTVDYHLRQIFRKLDVASRVELTRLVVARAANGRDS